MKRPVKGNTVERTCEICDMCANADICKYKDSIYAFEIELNSAIDHVKNKSGFNPKVADMVTIFTSCKYKALQF